MALRSRGPPRSSVNRVSARVRSGTDLSDWRRRVRRSGSAMSAETASRRALIGSGSQSGARGAAGEEARSRRGNAQVDLGRAATLSRCRAGFPAVRARRGSRHRSPCATATALGGGRAQGERHALLALADIAASAPRARRARRATRRWDRSGRRKDCAMRFPWRGSLSNSCGVGDHDRRLGQADASVRRAPPWSPR